MSLSQCMLFHMHCGIMRLDKYLHSLPLYTMETKSPVKSQNKIKYAIYCIPLDTIFKNICSPEEKGSARIPGRLAPRHSDTRHSATKHYNMGII